MMGTDGVIDCAANIADSGKQGLNDIIACVGATFGSVKVANVHPAFDNKALALTHIAQDIHPNDAGYDVITDEFIAAIGQLQ